MSENREHFRYVNKNQRFEKPFMNAPRNPMHFWRRPSFPFSKKRIMSGRYPNMGIRNFRPMYRPESPRNFGISTSLRYPMPNQPASSFIQRSPFFCVPRNAFDNKNNQYIFPATNVQENQVAIAESAQQKSEPAQSNAFSDLWVESLAPGGRIHYYNTRTREFTWQKPVNVRIIELDEIKQLTACAETERSEKILHENPEQNVQQQPFNSTYVNAFHPKNVSMPTLVVFPPNVCNPPPNFIRPPIESIQNNTDSFIPSSAPLNFQQTHFIRPPTENIQKNFTSCNSPFSNQNFLGQPSENFSSCNPPFPSPDLINLPGENSKNIANCNIRYTNYIRYNIMMPPPAFPIPVVAQNLLPTSIINECNDGIPQNLLLNDSIGEYSSNIEEDVLRSFESVVFTNSNQNLLCDETIDCNENAAGSCLSCNKMDDHSATIIQNSSPKNEKIDSSTTIVSVIEIRNDSEQTRDEALIHDDKEVKFVKGKNEKPNVSTLQSNISNSSSNSIEMKIIKYADENTMKDKNETLSILKSKNDVTKSGKSKDSVVVETKQTSIKPINKNKSIDKSRPVSSTPIRGTSWSVVWTGDGKVFYHDSESKVSVWERPAVLLNRSDVDKVIIRSPLSFEENSSTKEVRKTASNSSNMTKKLRKEDEKIEKSQNKEAAESVKVQNLTDTENTIEVKDEPESDTLSYERKIEMFCEMLSDNKVSICSTWEKEVHKIVFDSRYLLLPAEERKQVFAAYIKRKSQEEIIKHRKEYHLQKEAFIALLTEAGVTSNSLFSDIVHLYSKDARFKAIEKMKKKENIFHGYVSELIRKDLEQKRFESEQKRNFIELLSERNCIDKEWSEVQSTLKDDERYKAICNISLKESLFKEYIKEKCLNSPLSKKQKRINFCMKNREEEVKRNLSGLNNQEKERENQKRTLAVLNFKTLLEDLIQDSDISWQSAHKILKVDRRWSHSQNLGPEKSEELFTDYINALNRKKREQFHRFLDELSDITLKTSWKDIREVVLKDDRCVRFSSNEKKCEKEFKVYMNWKVLRAKSEFKQLLKETKMITCNSKSRLSCSNHLELIEKALSQDKRYLNLDCIRKERSEILLSYINKLHSKASLLQQTTKDSMKDIKFYK